MAIHEGQDLSEAFSSYRIVFCLIHKTMVLWGIRQIQLVFNAQCCQFLTACPHIAAFRPEKFNWGMRVMMANYCGTADIADPIMQKYNAYAYL